MRLSGVIYMIKTPGGVILRLTPSSYFWNHTPGGLERKTASLAHIIRSQTSLPAKIMNWQDRGWIKKDYKADIVILDLKNIKTKTSISNPHQYSEGVRYLIVNGKLVIENGDFNGTLAGEVIKLKK